MREAPGELVKSDARRYTQASPRLPCKPGSIEPLGLLGQDSCVGSFVCIITSRANDMLFTGRTCIPILPNIIASACRWAQWTPVCPLQFWATGVTRFALEPPGITRLLFPHGEPVEPRGKPLTMQHKQPATLRRAQIPSWSSSGLTRRSSE